MENNFNIFNWLILFINVLIVIFMFVFIKIKWDDLPDEIPSHYNFNGECDSYSGKSTIYVIPIVSIGLTLIYSLLLIVFNFIPKRYWKIKLGIEEIELSDEAKGKVINYIGYLLISTLTITNMLMTYILMCMIYLTSISTIITLIFVAFIIISSIVFIVLIYKLIYRETH
ncbi:hypothetical protein H8356DRAFT_1744425 [Neocallimastix lanati (nom. inval.)]|nr:hypothetical protein H8356DRAFT_1744425 [Neocallimastix sp. JGI-2020a]